MKKISITFLLALTIISVANLASPPEASAKRIDEDGATWWSVPELLDYKKTVDEEMRSICGDDMDCYQNLYFSKIENGDSKFRALEMLTEQQFVLTGVNPSKNTIKVLFFDEDMMLSRMGVREQLSLENLYIGLFDYQIDRVYNYGASMDDFANKTVSGAHEVYLWDVGDNTPPDVIPNQESELKNTSGLPLDTFDRFGYSIFAGQFNAQGQLYYGSCFGDPEYKEGEECHLMVSPEKGTTFFVSQEKPVPTNDSSVKEASINTEEPNSKNGEPEKQNNQEDNGATPSQSPQITPSEQNEQKTQTESTVQSIGLSEIKTPETGTIHEGEENYASESSQVFPYITLSAAIIIIFAIFLAKKYKKGVDNATGV